MAAPASSSSSSSSSPVDFLLRRSPSRRRKQPLAGAFFAPADIAGAPLLRILVALTSALVTTPPRPFQRHNFSSLIRKLNLLLSLLESLLEHSPAYSLPRGGISDPANLCFRELYVVLFRIEMLFSYISGAGRVWALIRGSHLSAYFRDIDAELAVVLDVFPTLRLHPDARDYLSLLRAHCRRPPNSYLEADEIALRQQLLDLLHQFEHGGGEAPDCNKLRDLFVDRLGIRDAGVCRAEIEYLDEQIMNQEEDTDLPMLGGVVALVRYCRFTIFAAGEPAEKASTLLVMTNDTAQTPRHRLLSSWGSVGGDDSSSFGVPKEFSCPISLDLMRDPVVVSTGQTYDRPSIVQWIEEGHNTCPNSGLLLPDKRLVPNRALRSLIAHWCSVYGIHYDSPESSEVSLESIAMACNSKVAIEANKATAVILVRMLSEGSDNAKAVAAREIRLLAKTGRQNRSFIAELGAIPLLSDLLTSVDSFAQENAVTALLNLSIFEGNKARIMELEGCLTLIVHVLQHGRTTEARENAAATLFSLSVIHEYKKMIMDEPGAAEELAGMLRKGTKRGKKDAVMALFNLSTHVESSQRMLDSGAVEALVEVLGNDAVSEEAAGALALLMKQATIAHVVADSDNVVTNLMALMRKGTPKGKENAVAALHEMCRRSASSLTHRVARTPGLNGLLQNFMVTGTKRARKKAALIARMCQRCDWPIAITIGNSFSSIDHTLVGNNMLNNRTMVGNNEPTDRTMVRNSALRRAASFGSGDLAVSTPLSISVPVP